MIQGVIKKVGELQKNISVEEIESSFNFKSFIYDYLTSNDLTADITAKYINTFVLLLALLIVVFAVDFITRKLLLNTFSKFALASKSNFDDLMIKNKVSRNVAHIIPLLIFIKYIPAVLFHFQGIEVYIEKALKVFAIILTLWIVRSLLNTLKDYFKTLPRLKDKPVDSYIQVFMIFAWIIGLLYIIFVVLTDTQFLDFITGIGAASAVIILVFKDTIMGFVASIQVSINDMVRIGDWITFEKYGADGDVTEINLATVKVQNFDKTITTIPTYALISDSFKNWRGMMTSDGRRIKRSVSIKMASVHYLTKGELEKLQNIELIKSYLQSRQKDIDTYNSKNSIDKEALLNGKNLTNIGVFRKYVQTYIEQHSAINKDMTIMARQLAPTTQGIPIEIYAFSNDKRWANYEYIMADIFDHLIAAIPYFDLEIFELPSGSNFTLKQ